MLVEVTMKVMMTLKAHSPAAAQRPNPEPEESVARSHAIGAPAAIPLRIARSLEARQHVV